MPQTDMKRAQGILAPDLKSLFTGQVSGIVIAHSSTSWLRDNKPALAGTAAAAPSITKTKHNQCVQFQKEATENKQFLFLLLCFTLP